MDVVFTRCAGLDVHKKSITACRIVPDPAISGGLLSAVISTRCIFGLS